MDNDSNDNVLEFPSRGESCPDYFSDESEEYDYGIDHDMTDYIVCPYCNHVVEKSEEIPNDEGELICESCNESFFYEREIEITYTTWKKEKE